MTEFETVRVVELEQIEGFEFRVRFAPGLTDLVMDEGPPLGGGAGPEASRVLAAAVGNCLSASLLLCLQKGRIETKGMKTRVELKVERNERGRYRVERAEVRIGLDVGEEGRAKFDRCASLFEDYCIVTASVRQGIPVGVTIVDGAGRELYRTEPATAAQ